MNLTKMHLLAALLSLAMGWFVWGAGLDPSLKAQMRSLEAVLARGKYGSTRDYWLTQASGSSSSDRVALVFGVVGDLEFFREIADLLTKKRWRARNYCEPAN